MSVSKHARNFKYFYIIALSVIFRTVPSVLSSFTCPEGCICTIPKGLTNCSDTQLTAIPSNISHRTTNLQLGNNQLSNITWQDFENLGFLEELNLKRNAIREIKDAPFRLLANLTKLVLRNNGLVSLSANSFQGLSSLQTLTLSFNKLVNFPVNLPVYTPNLKRLLLGSNKISVIGKNCSNMKGLLRLLLGSNQIHKITEGAFTNCSMLTNLDMKNNALVSITHELMLSSLSRLQQLDLSNNTISNISSNAFVYLKKLTILYLESNPLESLPCSVFDELSKLRTLNLKQRSMQDIAANGENCTNKWFKVFRRQYHIDQMQVQEPIDTNRPITISDASKQ